MGNVAFDPESAKRISDIVRQTEAKPVFNLPAGGFSALPPQVPEWWAQLSSSTPSANSTDGTLGMYPAALYQHDADPHATAPWLQVCSPVWLNPPNGEKLVTGTKYRVVGCGLANDTPAFDAIVPGVPPFCGTSVWGTFVVAPASTATHADLASGVGHGIYFDTGPYYSFVTNLWTAPFTGYYDVSFQVTESGGAGYVTGINVGAWVQTNTGAQFLLIGNVPTDPAILNPPLGGLSNATVLKLTAGQTLQLMIFQSDASHARSLDCTFTVAYRGS